MVIIHPQARVAFERLTHYGPGYTVEVTIPVSRGEEVGELYGVLGEAGPIKHQPHCPQACIGLHVHHHHH